MSKINNVFLNEIKKWLIINDYRFDDCHNLQKWGYDLIVFDRDGKQINFAVKNGIQLASNWYIELVNTMKKGIPVYLITPKHWAKFKTAIIMNEGIVKDPFKLACSTELGNILKEFRNLENN